MLRSFSPLLAVLMLLSAAAPLVGCTEAERQKMEYRSKRAAKVTQEGLLRERAREYWDAVRWQNWGEGSKFLELSENPLGLAGGSAVARLLLEEGCQLVALLLRGCSLRPAFEALSEALAENASLQDLDLSDNACGAEGAQFLGHEFLHPLGLPGRGVPRVLMQEVSPTGDLFFVKFNAEVEMEDSSCLHATEL